MPIPRELLSRITTRLVEAPVDRVDIGPDGDSIALLTAAGDPFVIFHQSDGTFYWPEDEYAKVWMPTGKTADEIAVLFKK